MIEYFSGDRKRIHHAMKVYGFACALWSMEAESQGLTLEDPRRISLMYAAILHDIGIIEAESKHGSCDGKFQEAEGPAIAEMILKECGVDEETRSRVCFLIGHHHTYQAIDDIDFMILVEADLFVNLEENDLSHEAVREAREKWMKTSGSAELFQSFLPEKQI
jgi:predicted metal-dependent HD superfamily phosphohydrolase